MNGFENFGIGLPHDAERYYLLPEIRYMQRFLTYLQKTVFWRLCSIFSNGGNVFFSRIKNPNGHIVWDTIRNKYAHFHGILYNGFWDMAAVTKIEYRGQKVVFRIFYLQNR